MNGGAAQVAVAAVTLRPGTELAPQELTRALEALPRGQRPAVVQAVEAIPVTTWFRPLTGPLREAGIPQPGQDTSAWYLDSRGRYTALTDDAHQKLVGEAA
jgi:putative long chain acyl-CoA synthase